MLNQDPTTINFFTKEEKQKFIKKQKKLQKE